MVHHVQLEVFSGVMLKATPSIFADANDVWNDINPYDNKPAEKGKIYIYISDLNPPEVDTDQPSFTVIVYDINKCQTIQQVIERSSRDYSPIRRKLFVFMNCY